MPATLLQDVRFAFRNLGRSPGFTFSAVVTLALGIGANTAIFSAIDEALFRPLSFPHPEQLVDVFSFNKATRTYLSSSYPEYEELRDRARSFQLISAFVRMPLNVQSGGVRRARTPVEAVTGNYFAMLRLSPVAGRVFRAEDDVDGAAPVAMISASLGDAGAIGATIRIEDQSFTVIGIIGKDYRGTNLNWGESPKVWVPLHATLSIRPRFRTLGLFHERQMQWLVVTGRLKTGVTLAQAQAEVRTIATSERDLTAVVFSASRSKFWPAYRDSIERSLSIFAVAAGLVLLLTCANVSNLLLSRALGRRREFAIRLSIGAGRSRLVRQLLTESLLLVIPSFALALGVAYGLGRVLLNFPNALGLPLTLDLSVEGRVLLFCLGLSLVTTLLFGLAPAMEATRTAVLSALKESGNGASSGGRGWFRNLLVVAQVAFSMVLLVGGGLFARSVLKGGEVDTGFRTEGLLTAAFNAPIPGSSTLSRFRQDQRELVERLRGTAGVDGAALASEPPLSQMRSRTEVRAGDKALTVERQIVGENFFRAVEIPLIRGREFTARDDETAPKAAVINQALAERLWPDGDAVGRMVLIAKSPARIVGVVRDSRYVSVWDAPLPFVYLAEAQSDAPAGYVIVRADMDSRSVAGTVAGEWARLSPRAPLYDMRTGQELLNIALGPQRMAAGILGAFGLLAILLSAVGLYSVMAFAVARRTREIGIRLAIGARPDMVLRQVIGRSMALAGAGIAVGAGLSGMLVRFLASQVRGISVYDGVTFGFVALLLGLVAGVAATLPALRAARIDPQVALRYE